MRFIVDLRYSIRALGNNNQIAEEQYPLIDDSEYILLYDIVTVKRLMLPPIYVMPTYI